MISNLKIILFLRQDSSTRIPRSFPSEASYLFSKTHPLLSFLPTNNSYQPGPPLPALPRICPPPHSASQPPRLASWPLRSSATLCPPSSPLRDFKMSENPRQTDRFGVTGRWQSRKPGSPRRPKSVLQVILKDDPDSRKMFKRQAELFSQKPQ